jgi:hypothetical protein
MSIPTTIQGLVKYVVDRADFVDKVTGYGEEAVERIRSAADQLDADRKEADELVTNLATVKFAISDDDEIKAKQARYLALIEQLCKDIQDNQDDPELVRVLRGQRAELYLILSNLQVIAIKNCVPFTPQDAEELRVLLRRSALDAGARKIKAHVLDAAIQLSKLAFQAAKTVAIA